MIFIFLLHFSFCNSSFHLSDSSSISLNLLKANESECIYDQLYTKNIISYDSLCIINSTFKSLKSPSKGGAIFICIEYKKEQNIILNNCKVFDKIDSTDIGKGSLFVYKFSDIRHFYYFK